MSCDNGQMMEYLEFSLWWRVFSRFELDAESNGGDEPCSEIFKPESVTSVYILLMADQNFLSHLFTFYFSFVGTVAFSGHER